MYLPMAFIIILTYYIRLDLLFGPFIKYPKKNKKNQYIAGLFWLIQSFFYL